MNRADIAERVLRENIGKRVTIGMLVANGIPFYTARNAVAEAKKRLDPKFYAVRHEFGEVVADNGWVLEETVDAEPTPCQPVAVQFRAGQGEFAEVLR